MVGAIYKRGGVECVGGGPIIYTDKLSILEVLSQSGVGFRAHIGSELAAWFTVMCGLYGAGHVCVVLPIANS